MANQEPQYDEPTGMDFAPPPEAQATNLPAMRPAAPLSGVADSTQVVLAQAVSLPRNEAAILAKLKVRAAMAGDDWIYRYPVKDGGATKYIEGAAIKCTDNVLMVYGNCTLKTRVQDAFDTWIIHVQFVDYETGVVLERPYIQSKAQQTIKTKDAGRREQIAFQIGVSKAQRNVVAHALQFFVDFAFEEARGSFVDKVGKDMPRYISRIKERLGQLKVDVKRVEAVVGRSIDKWLATDVARVIAELQAVADNMATPDETWPGDAPPKPNRESVKAEAQSKSASPPNPGAAQPGPAHQGTVATRGEVAQGRSAPANVGQAQNGAEAAPSFDLMGDDGEVLMTLGSAHDFATALVQMCADSPSIASKLAEANKANVEKAKMALVADEGTRHLADKLFGLQRTDEASAEPEPEPEKPIQFPRKADGKTADNAAYIKEANTLMGNAPDEAAVRALWDREKPNRDMLPDSYKGALKIRAMQRLAQLGVADAQPESFK